MKRNRALALVVVLVLRLGTGLGAQQSAPGPHHYVFFEFDRVRIRDSAFLATRAIEGAQLKYSWRELEPERGRYDLGAIEGDLRFLQEHGKKLFVQLQDVSFDSARVNVPGYLVADRAYHGGIAPQYLIPDDDESRRRIDGWVPRRWDPAVQARFRNLLVALGRQFDGRIEGINLPETSIGFGTSGRLFPAGFTFDSYRRAVIDNMRALKAAFPRSVALQYVNFMPGEWLPEDDGGYLRSVYEAARELGVGVGGPDLLPHKRGQMKHSYPLIRSSSGIVPTGIAVQWGNYEHVDPTTGHQVTVADLLAFATGWLHVDYIFWCTEEPYYSRDVLPVLAHAAP